MTQVLSEVELAIWRGGLLATFLPLFSSALTRKRLSPAAGCRLRVNELTKECSKLITYKYLAGLPLISPSMPSRTPLCISPRRWGEIQRGVGEGVRAVRSQRSEVRSQKFRGSDLCLLTSGF